MFLPDLTRRLMQEDDMSSSVALHKKIFLPVSKLKEIFFLVPLSNLLKIFLQAFAKYGEEDKSAKQNPGLDITTKFASFMSLTGCFHFGKLKKTSIPMKKKNSVFLYLLVNFLIVSTE